MNVVRNVEQRVDEVIMHSTIPLSAVNIIITFKVHQLGAV